MDDVRSVVHGLVESMQQELVRDLLILPPNDGQDWKPEILPRISIEKLFDNPAELTAGWSWLQDARTEWTVGGADWMYGADVRGFDDVQWNDRGIEQYFRAVRRWKEQLIVLVHLSAGAPARATELMSIQHKNGPEAKSQRGIFIENQMMAFVTTYYKGYSAGGRFKVIHRFVPEEVAELVAYYLWLVQPFVEYLQFVSKQYIGEPSSFLWEPEPEEDWEAGEDEEIDEELNDEDTHIDQGEEICSAVPANVDGFWDTNRVRKVMQRETEKRIAVRIGVALWRQAYPAI
ncbi:hypothetical protein CLAFUW4_09815 [Fulvia fulva]|uniref:Uncharacterized protein n=1 Tax=Passalora fulva TaxID=5499 RepID=A0A9Q8PIG8_PASFU|nr:uncharacterized protein CLAFUR5_12423 [Fulvia fulva]KAK4616724.1 hypothetical protein CLAFUR0_09814 [Fulvia fulva]UJO23058.1 hypothetical protein CLAFUR5_12423 [Fulvia fulva]WPV18844.1 hypothetical protein CLAFUW4_09815 [Fulvia fulva]WPV33870.1 hypothetical protein CLAFUW7_09818 [Fulvia fulva]